MESSVRKDEVENYNSIRERVNEWNQLFVKTKQKIKIQSGIGWKSEIKCS